jgi:hypothetical protein
LGYDGGVARRTTLIQSEQDVQGALIQDKNRNNKKYTEGQLTATHLPFFQSGLRLHPCDA